MLISLLNDINTLKSTDNATPIELAIMNEEQEFVNLSEYKNINISIGMNGVIYSSITPEVLDDNKTMLFTLDGNLPFGKYILEVNLIKDDDTVHVAPNRGDFPFTIEKSLNELGETVTLMSVQELISRIDDVKILSEDSNAKVTQAVASANNAVDVANAADINANNAITISQTAINDSNDALIKANKAIVDSETALKNSNIAKSNSSDALSNSETALSNSQTALNNSNEALTNSNKSIDDSSEALTKANKAITDSSESLTKANKAIEDSDYALDTANEAKTLATNADTNASQAKSDSTTALSTANNAKNIADQVRDDFDEIMSGNTDAEVVNARTNASGVTFTNVKARLDDSDSKLNQATETITNLQQILATADKNAVGLGNVDNTSDLDKPISTATQAEIDSLHDMIVNTTDDFEGHASSTRHIHYIGTVTGTNFLYSTYSAISEAEVVNGLGVCFVPVNEVTEEATLELLTSDELPILDQRGKPVTSMKAGMPYTARLYNGNFILQGEGGGASDEDISLLITVNNDILNS